ncbi:MAG: hypothetical protein ACKOWG_01435 [Planctomycetia bacterium]
MIRRLRFEPIGLALAWGACVVAVVTGCAGPAGDHAEEAHAVPAHHPRTFRRAVAEIGRRGAALSNGGLDPASQERERLELLDIVRWLPELAADTELGRRDWERVRDAARDLADGVERSAGNGFPGADLTGIVEQAMRTLTEADAALPPDVAVEETT